MLRERRGLCEVVRPHDLSAADPDHGTAIEGCQHPFEEARVPDSFDTGDADQFGRDQRKAYKPFSVVVLAEPSGHPEHYLLLSSKYIFIG